jgi:hypothetical protein
LANDRGLLFSNIITVGKLDTGSSYFILSISNANSNALDLVVECNKLPKLLHFSLARRPAVDGW